jgi:hypothetical protein
MPVGAPPPIETLERLRPKVVELVDQSPGLCPLGGRLVTNPRVGDYMTRRVLHWVETGQYPQTAIKPECGVANCVDCGRLTPSAEPAPPAEVIPAPPPVPQPSVPPPTVAPAGPVAERSGAGGEDAPLGASSSLVPVPVPAPVPSGFQLPGWVSRAALLAVGLVVLVVAVIVSVQGVSFGVSTLSEQIPEVDLQVVTTTSTTGV